MKWWTVKEGDDNYLPMIVIFAVAYPIVGGLFDLLLDGSIDFARLAIRTLLYTGVFAIALIVVNRLKNDKKK